MDLFQSRYYKICRILLIAIGQWPYDHSRSKMYKNIFIHLYTLHFLSTQACTFITSKISFSLVLHACAPSLIIIVCYTKYVTYTYMVDVLIQLMDRIKHDWSLLKEEEEIEILKKYTLEGRTLTFIYVGFVCVGVCFYSAVQFFPCLLDVFAPLNSTRVHYVPYAGEYFVEQEKYFYPIALHILLTIALYLIMAAAADSLYICFQYHMCAKFAILGHRLEHLVNDVHEGCSLTKKVIGCVHFHRQNVENVRMIVSCYSSSYIIQLLLSIFVITSIVLSAFESLNSGERRSGAFIYMVHASGYTLVVFLNFFPNQRLLDCSGEVFYRAYFARWYEAPLKIQKLILFIMLRSMESCGIQFANYMTASMEIFSSTLQTSLSYFTVLYSIQQG